MTLKRPKDKGTRFETDVVNGLKDHGLEVKRTPASSRYDIDVRGSTGYHIDALATRPDYGQTLVTIRLHDFAHLLSMHGDNARIECKRLAKVALHSIFEDKFS